MFERKIERESMRLVVKKDKHGNCTVKQRKNVRVVKREMVEIGLRLIEKINSD